MSAAKKENAKKNKCKRRTRSGVFRLRWPWIVLSYETMDKVGIKVQCCLGVIDKSEYMCDDIIHNIDESLGDTELDGLPIAKLS